VSAAAGHGGWSGERRPVAAMIGDYDWDGAMLPACALIAATLTEEDYLAAGEAFWKR
jgi:methyl-accepting chemotaxis protein